MSDPLNRVRPWGADVPVSKPEPAADDLPILVDFGGVGMTAGGLTTTITSSDIDDVFLPPFAPEGWRG